MYPFLSYQCRCVCVVCVCAQRDYVVCWVYVQKIMDSAESLESQSLKMKRKIVLNRGNEPWNGGILFALSAILIIISWLIAVFGLPILLNSNTSINITSNFNLTPVAKGKTLVIYVFSGSDPEYANNLSFFLRHAVKPNDNCTYLFIIQQGEGLLPPPQILPKLPSNARYITHPNECFDLGTIGWALSLPDIAPTLHEYTYFIWLNSSVRGPFMPAYLHNKMHWTLPFLDKITDATKLVGATISCGGSHGSVPRPHVQTYIAATDSIGLNVLTQNSKVFACYDDIAFTVLNSEIGASTAIINSGYSIDSLMLRYQGINWKEACTDIGAGCNAAMNPLPPEFNDGITITPLEVMFVKVKGSMKAAQWPQVEQAIKYDTWLSNNNGREVSNDNELKLQQQQLATSNEWMTVKAQKAVQAAEKRGKACFDHLFYIQSNAYDIGFMGQGVDPAGQAWEQFLRMGIYEGRPHRFLC